MSDDFKRKLEAYENGDLSEEELDKFEKELEKLETYQTYLEEDQTEHTNNDTISQKKQKRIVRFSKWKARIQTAFSALIIIIAVTIVSSILTSIYYAWGTPDRIEVYRNVIDQTLTITDPYGQYGGTNINTKPFFGLEATREREKKIGHETITVGEMEVNFLFSMMSYPIEKSFGAMSQYRPSFYYPGDAETGMSEWDRLEKLPEGTVVSAYVSFSELTGTEETFQLFEERDLDLIWLAVDSGLEGDSEWYGDPMGFPSSPIWHDDDMILDFYEEEEGWFLGKSVSEGYSSPNYTEGDETPLHQQFLKTLKFLEKHEKQVDKIYSWIGFDLSKQIDFIEENGIKHYGVVITGPTKEVLSLQEEDWITEVEIDEVRFWNWHGDY